MKIIVNCSPNHNNYKSLLEYFSIIQYVQTIFSWFFNHFTLDIIAKLPFFRVKIYFTLVKEKCASDGALFVYLI